MKMLKAGRQEKIKLEPGVLLEQASDLSLFPQKTISLIQGTKSRGGPWDAIENLGASPEDIRRTECYLLLVVLDDSGSMRGAEREAGEAFNAFLKDYKQAKKSEEISSDVLIAVATLNRGLIYPYTRIENARSLDSYYAGGNTPLYDVTLKAEGLQIAKTTELALYGVAVKTVTLLITDGCDEGSYAPASEVKRVLKSIQQDRNHIVGGIYRGWARKSTFTEMGIPAKWVLDGGSGGRDLLNAFSRFSKASRTALSKGDGGVISS